MLSTSPFADSQGLYKIFHTSLHIQERMILTRLHRPFSPPGTLGTGGTQSFQPPRYPGDWRDAVLSTHKVTQELVGFSPFRRPGTILMETDGTQSFMAPRYRGDWWDAVPRVNGGLKGLSPFRRPGTLLIGTGGTESFLAPSYPGDWRDSIRLAPEVPWGCLLYTSPSPRDRQKSRMPSSA